MTGNTQRARGGVEMKRIKEIVAFAFLICLALTSIQTVLASHDLSGQGLWLVRRVVSGGCKPVSETEFTCTHEFTGTFYGSITGSFDWVVTRDVTIVSSTPTRYDATITGTLTCDPCTVAGLTGTLTFSTSAVLTDFAPNSHFSGTLTVITATGGLTGTTGTGTWASGFHPSSQEYSIELSLP
jgi:hypothetical protein